MSEEGTAYRTSISTQLRWLAEVNVGESPEEAAREWDCTNFLFENWDEGNVATYYPDVLRTQEEVEAVRAFMALWNEIDSFFTRSSYSDRAFVHHPRFPELQTAAQLIHALIAGATESES